MGDISEPLKWTDALARLKSPISQNGRALASRSAFPTSSHCPQLLRVYVASSILVRTSRRSMLICRTIRYSHHWLRDALDCELPEVGMALNGRSEPYSASRSALEQRDGWPDDWSRFTAGLYQTLA